MLSKADCKKIFAANGIQATDEMIEKILKYLTSLAYLDYELFTLNGSKNEKDN